MTRDCVCWAWPYSHTCFILFFFVVPTGLLPSPCLVSEVIHGSHLHVAMYPSIFLSVLHSPRYTCITVLVLLNLQITQAVLAAQMMARHTSMPPSFPPLLHRDAIPTTSPSPLTGLTAIQIRWSHNSATYLFISPSSFFSFHHVLPKCLLFFFGFDLKEFRQWNRERTDTWAGTPEEWLAKALVFLDLEKRWCLPG